MEKSLASGKNLTTQWTALKSARPAGESEFSQFGFPSLRHLTFDDLFSEWVKSLEQVETKTKWLERSQSLVLDVTISKWIDEIVSVVAQTQSNGFQWHE